GGLWGLALQLNDSQARDRRIHSFPAESVREICIDTGAQRVPFQNLRFEVVGQPETATISVEIIREASGRSIGHAGEALNEINAQASMRDGRLTVTAALPNPRWWFYHYPSLELLIRVPSTFPVSLHSQGKSRNGLLKLRELSGQVSIDVDSLGIEMDQVTASNLEIVTNFGSIEGRNLDIATCSLRTRLGSIELERVRCGNGHFETDLGSIDLSRVSGPISLQTRLGSIEVEEYSGSRLDARTDSGSIDASIDKLDPSGEIRLETRMGSVDLHLPGLLRPNLKLDTKMGHIENAFASVSPASDAPRITAVTSMGSIEVSRTEHGDDDDEEPVQAEESAKMKSSDTRSIGN
ncbi:MAG TPA: DUF4097 family beta strand repeat-containing protein, partial [Candidatus Ozemobacteraceae bacterium]|nr:DUF4097 family beta strand repeat-containing protein [Candidatus Ozemobacteraceae bacterium]